ncbi:MAG: alpha/beta hydrolase [Candidatus Lokiarchaeota archaeon]|nr:alpha/beta hydrolase [Candidatus Lokiarchaeota archaeon]
MSIIDKSKLKRPEIIEIFEYRQNFRNQVNEAFFKSVGYTEDDYRPLWKKVGKINKGWLNGENVKNILSMKEMLLLAKHLRFYMEYSADYFQKLNPIPKEAIVKSVKANDIPCEWHLYPGVKEDRAILYTHGGGHIMGSTNTHRLFTLNLAKITNIKVLSINYRLAPEEPHPAALEDCVSAYKWLLSIGINPQNIIISGDSAGGYYTLLTLLKLRDDGISLPTGAICLSPSTDMAQTGESVKINCYTDVVLGDLGYIWWIEAHLSGKDPYDPAISPLYADLRSLPPILIQVSTSEMLFDDSKRFYQRAKKAGVDITLQTWDDTLHVFQNTDLPETKEAMEKIKKFTEKLF